MTEEELQLGIELKEEIAYLEQEQVKILNHDFNTYNTITIDSRVFQQPIIKDYITLGLAQTLQQKRAQLAKL